jgi:hypothetical protein
VRGRAATVGGRRTIGWDFGREAAGLREGSIGREKRSVGKRGG